MSKHTLVIEHSPNVTPGLLGDFLQQNSIPHKIIRLHKGEKLAAETNYDSVISLGGIMGAYDEEEFPFLKEEKEFLRERVKEGVPVLGICLGCQLLADALGGKAFKGSKGHEVGFPKIVLTPEGTQDKILQAVPKPEAASEVSYALCHGDTWTLPPTATLLASSELYPQVFRLGSAFAVQFHPEATLELFEDWSSSVLRRYVSTRQTPPYDEPQRQQMVEHYKSSRGQLRSAAFALFQAWFASWRV